MARRKNAPDAVRIKNGLSERLRTLRTEFYGERGGPDQARELGIPVRTWYNYENGVTVPAEIILRVVELTSVEPIWLLRGEGSKFRNPPRSGYRSLDDSSLAQTPVKDLLRIALDRLEDTHQNRLDFSNGQPILAKKVVSASAAGLEPSTSPAPERWTLETDLADPAEEPAHEFSRQVRRNFQTLRVADDAMFPIVAEGAHVSYGEAESVSTTLHEKLVVAVIDGNPIVRWFQHCGKFGLLRSENPSANPPTILVELEPERGSSMPTFHRVYWISTPH